ncbi:MAG: gliding motility protein GldM, partial [Prevotella sp.]|nr:gliding motility protein GldM [Prevotella sp.]
MAIKKRPVSPRQKMINLMYVVLMAMLALNVSTEVLNGFSVVEESLNRTTANSAKENASIYNDFNDQMKLNPSKVKAWYDKANLVKQMSDSIYNFAQELKEAIVKEADGKNADIHNIRNKEDLEAASFVMLAPGTGKGRQLYNAINSYRERILKMVPDKEQRDIIHNNLTTELPKTAHTMGKNWQEYMFEDMPVAAAVTLLSKLQSDIRYAEGEVLHTLVANIDVKDIRVNKLDAFVIPEKTTLYPGETFSANIVMAAVDTTQTPEIYVNGNRINTTTGRYSFTAGG